MAYRHEDLEMAFAHSVSQNTNQGHQEAMAYCRKIKVGMMREAHQKCWKLIFITKDGEEIMNRFSSKEQAKKFVPKCGEFYDPTWDRMIRVRIEEENLTNLSDTEVLLIDVYNMDHYLKDIHCE